MLEKYLIEHCSPTLASIKTANLFTYAYETEEELKNQVYFWNRSVKEKGISLLILRKRNRTALIYVSRLNYLKRDLEKPGVREFLKGYGYESIEPAYALERLKSRLQSSEEFPHEIGLFLSYPLGDVTGFIENAGRNSKCCGCWKVYCNECEAIRTFAKYKKCKEVYLRLWNQGRSVLQLTVAA